MRRSLHWLEEQRLIWRAQQHGDRKAVEMLLKDNEPMITALAARVASFTGARKVESDLAQEARIIIFERIYGYEFGHCPSWWVWTRFLSYAVEAERVRILLAAAAEFDPAGGDFAEHVRGLRLAGLLEVGEEWEATAEDWETKPREKQAPALVRLDRLVRKARGARLRPARLLSYAYRKMISAMTSAGCDALEVVRLPRSSKVHAAHRRVDAGEDPAAVASELGIDQEVTASLCRTTLPEQDGEPDPVGMNESPGERLERRQAVQGALASLDADSRVVLVLMAAVEDPGRRAALLGVEPYDLWLLEQDARERFEQARRDG